MCFNERVRTGSRAHDLPCAACPFLLPVPACSPVLHTCLLTCSRVALVCPTPRERQLEAFSSQLAAVMQDWKEVVDGEAWTRGALAAAQAMADTAVAQRKDLLATAAAYKRRGVRVWRWPMALVDCLPGAG